MAPPRRKRRADQQTEEEEDEDDAYSDADARPRQRRQRNNSDDDGSEDEATAVEAAAVQQLAKKLVRYAISCEHSRTPIRREGIKEKVLGDRGRAFRKVFDLAQKQLRFVFGMELRELPMREKLSLVEKRRAMKSNTAVKAGSGAYILTSTLPDPYRSASIIAPSRIPNEADEAAYAGFYTLVVALISLGAGELSEQKLKRYLTRLNADHNVSSEKTETTLKKMERHGYVVKRIERPAVGQEGEQNITWHLGPRAKEEIGIDGVMAMVRKVFGEWDAELEAKLRSSLGLKAEEAPEQDGEDNEGERPPAVVDGSDEE